MNPIQDPHGNIKLMAVCRSGSNTDGRRSRIRNILLETKSTCVLTQLRLNLFLQTSYNSCLANSSPIIQQRKKKK